MPGEDSTELSDNGLFVSFKGIGVIEGSGVTWNEGVSRWDLSHAYNAGIIIFMLVL